MRLHLPILLLSALLAAFPALSATYSDLSTSLRDIANGVYYDGAGNFVVTSAATTSLTLTLDVNQFKSYLASNDYQTGTSVLWNYTVSTSCSSYGLSDNSSGLTGYWNGSAWTNAGSITTATLESYANAQGVVTLTLTSTPGSNSAGGGVQVTTTNASGATVSLYSAPALRNSYASATTGYWVNTNYITSVTINTASTLDVSTYEPPKDYTHAFVSSRTDGTSVGRIMFLGDSITHGVKDASWRWQFFKVLTDNGIENEIVGPRSGYHSTPVTSDAATNDEVSYGGVTFSNVHLAQASGRTYNIISGSNASGGVNYGGNSTKSASNTYNCDTYVCLMGTNDLLSDSGNTTDAFCTKMQNMLGGTVSYDATDGYTWTAGASWGNMGTIVTDSLRQSGDTMYIMSVPCWGTHVNSNTETIHATVQRYNELLKQWVNTYSEAQGRNIVYVESNRGLLDLTKSTSFTGNDAFFNAPGTAQGSDGLHPNEQGSIILAGNLAQAMGIAGRTGGLARSATTESGWTTGIAEETQFSAGTSLTIDGAVLSETNGYTIDLQCTVGDGKENGWASSEKALSITVADGTRSGTLNLSEGHIMWGSKVLFCQDNSAEGNDSLRVAWNAGDESQNVAQGYYVWLGDMLIGQGLSGSSSSANGITLTSSGVSSVISMLSYANEAYAPSTTWLTSAENALLLKNKTMEDRNSKAVSMGIDFSTAAETTVKQSCAITSAGSTDMQAVLNNTSGWFGVVNAKYTGEIDAKIKDGITTGASVFALMNGAAVKTLNLVVDDATVSNGTYNGVSGAIIGSYGASGATKAEALHMEVNGGTVKGDIVGGSVNGSCSIEQVSVTFNRGTLNGSIYGGSKVDGGTVGKVAITITGGTISGSVRGGGLKGTVSGDTSITISGGAIAGDVDARTNGSGSVSGKSSVRIEGNNASVGGSITADEVTLADVTANQYTNAFDSYSGTINTGKLTLEHVTTDLNAALGTELRELVLTNKSVTTLKTAEIQQLSTLRLDDSSSLGAYHTGSSYAEENESTITVTNVASFGKNVVLDANLSVGDGATLSIGEGGLTMGSTVTLGSGITLDSEVVVGNTYTLFTDAESFVTNNTVWTEGSTIDAAAVFSNVEGSLSYKNGNVNLYVTPEPATAALSLLGLLGLAARRRR